MTALATAQGLLQRLVDAIPAAWRQDPVFRAAAIGAGITGALFLLRLVGPHNPMLDAPTIHYDAVTQKAWIGPRDATSPPQPPLPEVLKIAPGHPLNGVTLAPGQTDHFGTFTPEQHP